MTTENAFFTEWEEASWHVVYADEDDVNSYLLKAGLVLTLHFGEASQKMAAAIEILRQFYAEFGSKLKCCGWNDGGKYHDRSATRANYDKCLAYLESRRPVHGMSYEFYSAKSFDEAGDYGISCYCPNSLREDVWNPKPVGYLQITLPVDYLRNAGASRFTQWVLNCATLLQPLAGMAGLGFQPARDGSDFQEWEYEGTMVLSGLEVGDPLGEDSSLTGFKCVNWYTVIDQRFVQKLGGHGALAQRLHEVGLQAIAYPHGAIVKAGDWPSIGWIEKGRGKPAPYVLANHILKAVRAPQITNMHYGSIADEVRFMPETTQLWQARFDVPDEEIAFYIAQMRNEQQVTSAQIPTPPTPPPPRAKCAPPTPAASAPKATALPQTP